MASKALIVLAFSLRLVICALDDNQISSQPASEKPAEIDLQFTNSPRYMYRCESSYCQRVLIEDQNSTFIGTLYESMSLCTTVCGRFGGIWPRPVTAVLSSQLVSVHPNFFRFDLQGVPSETRELIAEMTRIFTKNLLQECDGKVTEETYTQAIVYLNVRNSSTKLDWNTDESYELNTQMRAGNISATTISAQTIFGARHGLETLSQLVSPTKPEYDLQEHSLCGLKMLTGAKIKDNPVYPHRGLMLDTARNFIPMKDIRRTIDAMAASKMNVFHWHATDTQSFPLKFESVPQLAQYGAYSPEETYSMDEVEDLLHYALVRGVRVLLELDAPAHAGNGWQFGPEYGFGDLAVCVNVEPWRNSCIQPPCGQLNPINDHLYYLLKKIYEELAQIFPRNEIFHMGGDEVFYGCWNQTKEITDYMESRGIELTEAGFNELWGSYQTRATAIWEEVTKKAGSDQSQIILWTSSFTRPPYLQRYLGDKNRYVIQVWDQELSPTLLSLIKTGYRVIVSPKDRWYLDHGFYGNTRYSNWRKMYSYQPTTDYRHNNVLGGEVCMWTEYVDSNGMDARIWPRAAAVAERLWSNPNSAHTSLENAAPRMSRHNARLRSRGLRSDAIAPGWCEQNQNHCT